MSEQPPIQERGRPVPALGKKSIPRDEPPPLISAASLSSAWQPLTPRGVAAFGQASFARLFVVQFICASLCTAAAIWFFQWAWLPTLLQAVRQLPAEGEIRGGRLHWTADSVQRLAQGTFLTVAVDLQNENQARSPAHIEIVFSQTHFRVFSLFGFLQGSYPEDWRVAFNRIEVEAWWGAWKPAISAMAAASLLIGFLLVWNSLTTIYFLPARLIAFFGNRDLTLGRAWRLTGAALMPGALFLACAVVCYGLGAVDLIRLLLAFVVHFVLGWVYLLSGVFSTPPYSEVVALKGNPFVTANAASDSPSLQEKGEGND